MFKTRVCEVLGIEYPIVQAPMAWITSPELVAAVSNAGGLGILGPNAGRKEPEEDPRKVKEVLLTQIRRTKELTDKPFGVNITVGRGPARPFADATFEAVAEEKVPVVVTSTGSPSVYTERLHQANVKVLHAVASVAHARGAEAAGIDIVVCEGYEGGGHSGFDELTTFVLVPQVVDAVSIPVLAAGGVTDARGFLAALVLGAEGVYMGTRFITTHECPAHPAHKEAILKAHDAATFSWGRKLGVGRSLRNAFVKEYLELESSGAPMEQIVAYMREHPLERGLVRGDLEHGQMMAGAGSGMIKEIVGAGDVVKELIEGAAALMGKLERVKV